MMGLDWWDLVKVKLPTTRWCSSSYIFSLNLCCFSEFLRRNVNLNTLLKDWGMMMGLDWWDLVYQVKLPTTRCSSSIFFLNLYSFLEFLRRNVNLNTLKRLGGWWWGWIGETWFTKLSFQQLDALLLYFP